VESCQGVICGKFDARLFCGMKGIVRNESMRNVTEMNIFLNTHRKLETHKSRPNIIDNIQCKHILQYCCHEKRNIRRHHKLKYAAKSEPNCVVRRVLRGE